MPRRKQPAIPDELLDQLLGGADPRVALADGGLLDGLKKALAERALNAELDHHLESGEPDGRANGRNGYSAKSVLTDTAKLDLQIPRDLVSAVTDAVLDEVAEWQNRPLEALYPLVFLDAIRIKVRDEGTVRNKAVYVALGVRPDGTKEVLGLWIEQTEGAKFWLRVMNELKDREEVAAALKEIYRARTAELGEAALKAFDEGPWGRRYPVIAQTWRRHWPEVIPFYAFPAEVRRIIYTTNAIESLNAKLRRAVRARGHFPHDDAALKLLFLVLNRASKDWKMPQKEWSAAKAQFAILFQDRFAIT